MKKKEKKRFNLHKKYELELEILQLQEPREKLKVKQEEQKLKQEELKEAMLAIELEQREIRQFC